MVAKSLDDTKPKIHSKNRICIVSEENENFCVMFTYSMKRARKIRKFHMAVLQRWLKSLMYVQSCCIANITYGFFAVLFVVVKLPMAVIQTFCYHGNVTLHFPLFS